MSDPRCPPPSCCDQKGGRCWQHGLWTFSYCCAKDGAEDCYRWGEDSPGEDIASAVVHSGVQCRHMCQSHESCAYWTFIVDAAEVDLSMRGKVCTTFTSSQGFRCFSMSCVHCQYSRQFVETCPKSVSYNMRRESLEVVLLFSRLRRVAPATMERA